MFPIVERFLNRQKVEMMKLDEAEGFKAREDSGKDFSQTGEDGVVRGLREILYDNTIKSLLQDKSFYKEFNALSQPGALKEGTLASTFPAFTTTLLPAVRRIYSRLMAMELVSVQPLTAPTGYIFWLDHLFGTNVGGVHIGDRMDREQEKTYSDSSEKGAISEMNLSVRKKLVQTEVKKLKSIWTLEAAQDLKSQWGLDMVGEVLPRMADEITREIDSKLVDKLLAQVGTNTDWSMAGYLADDKTTEQRRKYRETIYEAITDTAAKIFKRKYVYPNWLLMNGDTFSYLAKLEKFAADPSVDPNQATEAGWLYRGTLAKKYKVYVSPWFTDNKILMGYRSDSWKDAVGYYAPFIPLVFSEEFAIAGDFTQRARGIYSRYAIGALGELDDDDKNYGLASVTLTTS